MKIRIQSTCNVATLCVLLFRLAHNLEAQTETWIPRATNLSHHVCNVYFDTAWNPDRGAELRIREEGGTRSATLSIARSGASVSLQPDHLFPPAIREWTQFNVEALPTSRVERCPVVMKFRQELWAVYIGNRPVAVLPPPFTAVASIEQPSANVPEGQAEARTQPVGDVVFSDNFAMLEEDANPLSQWEIISGNWTLHTAADDAMRRENIKPEKLKPEAKKGLKAAFSSNFFSLRAEGTNAIIAAGHDFHDSYFFESAVRLEPGEIGIVFLFEETGAFHAFTVRLPPRGIDAVLTLWKAPSTNASPRTILDAVTTPITHGQWVKLGVKLFQNRIQCYMDNIKVIDARTELPPGGRFGLFADGCSEARFDDVKARSNHDLDFAELNDVRRHTVLEDGAFFPRTSFFNLLFAPREKGNVLAPAPRDKPSVLVVGSIEHAGHVFSADFSMKKTRGGPAGLICGYRGDDKPYYRFTRRDDGVREFFLLESLVSNKSTTIEAVSVEPAGSAGPARSFTLMSDATRPDQLRFYRNRDMVIVHPGAGAVTGASGVFSGAGTEVLISNLVYKFEREDSYRSSQVENPIFASDPFMRNWASPEGQWLPETNKVAWHQGDFHGKFMIRLPFIPGTQAHLGVEEGMSNGEWIVSATQSSISLSKGPNFRSDKPLVTAPVQGVFSGQWPAATNTCDINCEGYWLWITAGDKLLLKHFLGEPLKGRRAKLDGFEIEHLKLSHVERENIKDYLFSESLYEWVINGGSWEVVNRFQCDPRWSHMNGETTNGLAAIWTKYLFDGDFCMELYAGIRHGWYQRCGDLNMTILNRRTTASEGYTITCTGWDHDLSQLFTRLYRNGTVVAESDKYLVPRYREGNRRLGFNPLLPQGGSRDVHGAWYHSKLRRVGKTVEFHFDNELVFRFEDPAPLGEGSAGIWTYLNSMMVARVKISAERIRPRPFQFKPAPLPTPSWSADQAEAGLTRHADVFVSRRPLETMMPDYWEADDPVGHSRLLWREQPGQGPYMLFENTLGGGPMFSACSLPPIPYPDIAGWRFELKRTSGARFNLHYSFGVMQNGEFTPTARYFHRISGPSFSLGPFKQSGATDVPDAGAACEGWDRKGEWNLVEVWLPAAGSGNPASDSNILVRLEGFGDLQPSYESQGLNGNGPGEGYAVRNFTEVLTAAPRFSLATNLPPPLSFSLLEFRTQKPLIEGASLQAVQSFIDSSLATGLQRPTLVVRRPWGESRHTISWLTPDPLPTFACEFDRQRPDCIVLKSLSRYPDRRAAYARMAMANILTPLNSAGMFDRWAAIPRRMDVAACSTSHIPVTVSLGTNSFNFSVPWQSATFTNGPVLMRIQGPFPLAETFESREMTGGAIVAEPARMALDFFDPQQGTCLAVFNTEIGQRLASSFSVSFSLSACPLFQFRYRAGGMTFVTLGAKNYYAHLSEKASGAPAVRYSSAVTNDGKWRTWLGMISDAVLEQTLSQDIFLTPSIRFGSINAIDQTGRYTRWNMDDLVVGPAVAQDAQLTFTPFYFDFYGVAEVLMAIRAGPEPWSDLPADTGRTLHWTSVSNCAPVTPQISGLPSGIAHIFLKARNLKGVESPVTDLPFLVDREPPAASWSFTPDGDLMNNDSVLNISIANREGGSPFNIQQATFLWDDKPVSIDCAYVRSTFTHSANEDRLAVRWPYMFRTFLNETADGQTHSIKLAGIRDGAGNSCPDLSIPLAINHRADRMPPSIALMEFPSTNVFWRTPWEQTAERNIHFASDQGIAKTVLVAQSNETSYLCTTASTNGGSIWHLFEQGHWSVATHPFLAFRIRCPEPQNTNSTRLDLVFEHADGSSNVLSLTHPPDSPVSLSLPQPVAWTTNQWHGFILDMRQLLAQKLPADKAAAAKIKSIRLNRGAGPALASTHLQCFYVFADWSGLALPRIVAYDATGIAEVPCGVETAEPGRAVVSPGIPVQAPNTGWVALSVKDKAGNSTFPFWVPMVSTNGFAIK